jgi:outer membrane protein insertion porin family
MALMMLLFACTVPRKYPFRQPFVFATNIKVEGSLSSADKKDLSARLANQLDDSLRVQVVSIAGVYRRVITPPVFDTANLRRSIGFMVALLNASGYYSPVIKDTIRRDTIRFRRHPERNEYRVMIDFRVWPGKQLKLDSIGWALTTPALQTLTMQTRGQTLLKKGAPYSKQILSAELDRLVTLFRNNGYYKFSKEDLYIEKDTVVAGLIDPTLDPFQQAALLGKLRREREKPTINAVVLQRPVNDSSRIMKYSIGHVTIYPDLPILQEDTVVVSNVDTSSAKGFTIVSRTDKFKPNMLISNIYMQPGQQYQLQSYVRTINRFNQMGAWQQTSINMEPSDSADSVLNAIVKLYPTKKYDISPNLEASRNTNDILTTGSLFGLAVNLAFHNRDAFHEAVQTTTNFRAGVELGGDFIQSTDFSLSHSIAFYKLIAPKPFTHILPKDSLRTVINGNASYTDRRLSNEQEFFTVRSINGSFGWEWNKGNKTYLWRPLNIEYTQLVKSDSFQRYLDSIPSLNLAFRTGLVIGQQFVYNSVKKHGAATDFLTFSAEESGATLGLIKALNKGDLWRFIRGDVTYRRHIDYRRTQLAFRAFAGAGLAYGKGGDGTEETLPFYKAFFAGGPNSMRGWQIRQLGLGSAHFYDTAQKGILDRFGDIALEGNIEYRFPLGTIFTIKVGSAIYVDAGNIWDRHPIDTTAGQKGSDFQINRFYNEIAVDAGTGLRFDFDWFIIRFDYAYKLRDPERLTNSDRWFYDMNLFKGQFQLGIGYPF